MNNKKLLIILLTLGLIGLGDSAYLTATHYFTDLLNCSILSGCETVLTSKYSVILGVPMALLGVIYYLVVFLFLVNCLTSDNKFLIQLIKRITLAGFIFSIALLGLQIFIIKAICLYCFVSFLACASLFFVSRKLTYN